MKSKQEDGSRGASKRYRWRTSTAGDGKARNGRPKTENREKERPKAKNPEKRTPKG